MARCRISLVVFDVDGVLVPIRNSWGYVHAKLGTTGAAAEHYKAYRRGLIGYREWMYLDTLAWIEARPGLTKWDLERLFDPVEPLPQAYEAVELLRSRGVEAAIVSGGVEVLVEKVASRLRIRHWLCPALSYDPWGRLIPGGEARIEAHRKDKAVRSIAHRLGVPARGVAFVGDSPWDIMGMRESCLSVAVNPVGPEVAREADYVAPDVLEAVKYILSESL